MQDVSGFFPAKHGAIPKLSAFPVSSWQVPPGTLFPPCLFLSAFLLWVRNRGLTLPLETPIFHFIGLKPVALSPQQVRFSFSLFLTFFHLPTPSSEYSLLSDQCSPAMDRFNSQYYRIGTIVWKKHRASRVSMYCGRKSWTSLVLQKGPRSPACPTESLCTSTKVDVE